MANITQLEIMEKLLFHEIFYEISLDIFLVYVIIELTIETENNGVTGVTKGAYREGVGSVFWCRRFSRDRFHYMGVLL